MVQGPHPLRVVSERGFVVWRRADRITVGDHVVSAAFGAEEAALGSGLDEDEAALLGYLVAEGSLGYEHSVRFTNWDPEVTSPSFYNYCTNITGSLNYPDLESDRSTAAALVSASGHKNDTAAEDAVLNAIGWYGIKRSRQEKSGQTQNEYFTTLNASVWQDTSIAAANASKG